MSRNLSPVFYDCEASSLEGFVIEIGWAFVSPDGETLVSAAHLVRPALNWNLIDAWDENAEALHQISRENLLKNGLPVWEVAAIMNRDLHGRELFSDSPKDEIWLGQIFEEAGIDPSFIVRRTDANVLLEQTVLNRNFGLARYGRAKVQTEKMRCHRAEADSLVWAHLWKRVTTSVRE